MNEGTCVCRNLEFIYSFQVPIKSYALKKKIIVRNVHIFLILPGKKLRLALVLTSKMKFILKD